MSGTLELTPQPGTRLQLTAPVHVYPPFEGRRLFGERVTHFVLMAKISRWRARSAV
jgi:hypothetical protein